MSMENFGQSLANILIQKGFDLPNKLEKALNRKRNIDRLIELLNTENNINDQINQIKSEFNDKNSLSELIHDLTTSLCLICFKNNKFNPDLFCTKCPILKPFLNKNYQLELECLKAIQLIDNELDQTHSTFIRIVFDIISNCCAVRDGAFSKWRTDGQPENKRSIERLKDFFSIESYNKRIQAKLLHEVTNNEISKKQQIEQQKIINQIDQATTSNKTEQNKLIQIFKKYDLDKSKLLNKLKNEFNNKQTLNKNEMNTLVNALCLSCMNSNKQFKLIDFNKRCLVLEYFINKNEAIEIETLKTIQLFLNQIENKTELDQVIFLFLYENYIINEKVFDAFYNPESLRKQQQTITNNSSQINSILQNQINSIFKRQNWTTHYVVKRLQNEFNQTTKRSKAFINGIVLAYLKSCMMADAMFQTTFFKNTCCLLIPFSRINITNELETLNCIVNFCEASFQSSVKGNILGVIFDILFMEEVITKEAFLKWKTNASEHNKMILQDFFHKLIRIGDAKTTVGCSVQVNSSSSAKNLQVAAKNESTESSCSICIETISNLKKSKVGLMSTQCGHIMCKLCCEDFFSKSKSLDCPICRKKLTRNLVHNLFI